jgi:NAD-dependent DNA ligase
MSEIDLINIITDLEGFSDKTSLKIVKNIGNANKFLESIDKFVTYKSNNTDTKKENKTINSLDKMSFLFSGFRDKNIENQIVSKGGEIAGSVNKNLSILIVLNKAESSGKIDKAKKLNIPIFEKEEFIKKYL